jgi:uncharacterized membrane protein
MAVDVTTELVIAAPVDVVAGFAANPSNVPAWYKNITSVEWLSAQPAQVGSKIAFVARFMGRTLRYTYEIVELLPNQRLVMRTAEGPFPMETTYTWQPNGDVTLMTLRNRGEPEGFSRLVAPLMATMMRRENRQDLHRLAAVIAADQRGQQLPITRPLRPRAPRWRARTAAGRPPRAPRTFPRPDA